MTRAVFSFLDFDNHIFVTTDAEAFFFLHDLISSYLKEKERVLSRYLLESRLDVWRFLRVSRIA